MRWRDVAGWVFVVVWIWLLGWLAGRDDPSTGAVVIGVCAVGVIAISLNLYRWRREQVLRAFEEPGDRRPAATSTVAWPDETAR